MLKKFPEPTHLTRFKWRGLFLFILLIFVMASLIAITHVQHQVRVLESQYYQALKASFKANEEWGRLRLEKEHLTAPARVEWVAKTQLNMTLDKSNYQTLYVTDALVSKLQSLAEKKPQNETVE